MRTLDRHELNNVTGGFINTDCGEMASMGILLGAGIGLCGGTIVGAVVGAAYSALNSIMGALAGAVAGTAGGSVVGFAFFTPVGVVAECLTP